MKNQRRMTYRLEALSLCRLGEIRRHVLKPEFGYWLMRGYREESNKESIHYLENGQHSRKARRMKRSIVILSR
ncbi:hypothetical protein Bca52824_023458 [Brassica carinata]|uniref:Uncharacterized protein n=1 Tax=Brassica carinata TaxID=52824 RepID=A0A8X7VIR5_BRACI|nr:hypothetical protein Bca52824_023458 [Brassica carinata]